MRNKTKNIFWVVFFLLVFTFFITPASADFNVSSNQSDLNWQVYATTPINLANTTGIFWVNYTWEAGTGRIPPSSWNVSINGSSWYNDTANTYHNQSTVAGHTWINISVWGYNSTDNVLSENSLDGQQQAANSPITITNTSDWQGDEGSLVYLDFNYTDLDNDTATFSTNATEGSLNTTTGVFTWTPGMSDQGTYFWNFTVSDGWGSEDYYVANITVNDSDHPLITDWWNNYTANNLTTFTIAAEDNRTVFFNVTVDQSEMTWYWYKDGDLVQSGSSDNYTATWDVGGIGKTIQIYGTNPNGQTQTLIWTIYIEYTAHEIEWLKLQEMEKQTEAEEVLGMAVLIGILISMALVLFIIGIYTGNSIPTILAAVIFFICMALPIPVYTNYAFFGIAVTGILFSLGLIALLYTFYQWFTSYSADAGYHKWDRYFDNNR